MQCFRNPHPVFSIFLTVLFINLLLGPNYDLILAQLQEDNMSPVIAHLPIKTALQGQPIPVIARVADDSEVGKVTVNFKKGGRFLDVPLPMVKTAESGAVKIKVTSEAAYVFSGPGMWNDTLATVIQDEVYETFEDEKEHGFYHIRLSDEVDAWLSYADATPVVTGWVYMGTIPSMVTFASEVVYRIAAEDISYNKISTLPYTIHIIKPEKQAVETKEEPQQPEYEQAPPSTGKPFYTKVWFWGGLAVIGGGVYYFATQQEEKAEKEQKGSIHIEGEW